MAGAGGADGGAGGQGGGGGSPNDPCATACAALDQCAQSECQGADGMALLRIAELCVEACDNNDSFAIVSAGIDRCSDRIAFARQNLAEEFAELCVDDGVPDEVPECRVFGDRIVECLVEGPCPALEAISEATADSYVGFCNGAVAGGQLSPMDLAMLVNANTPCDAPFIANLMAEQIDGEDGPGGEPGPLGAFCADGPLNEPATCEAACAELGPCIPEDDEGAALRDPLACQTFCLSNPEVPSEAWRCMAEASGCGEVTACFAAGPPPQNCVGYAARVRACTIEACPAAGEIGDGVQGVIEAVCESGELEAAVVDSVTDDTPCGEPAVGFFVSFFVNEDPENPEAGLLAGYCAEGPVNPPETCESACAALGPCVLPGSDGAILADASICQLSCVAGDDIPSDAWACAAMAGAGGCEAVQACFPEEGP